MDSWADGWMDGRLRDAALLRRQAIKEPNKHEIETSDGNKRNLKEKKKKNKNHKITASTHRRLSKKNTKNQEETTGDLLDRGARARARTQ